MALQRTATRSFQTPVTLVTVRGIGPAGNAQVRSTGIDRSSCRSAGSRRFGRVFERFFVGPGQVARVGVDQQDAVPRSVRGARFPVAYVVHRDANDHDYQHDTHDCDGNNHLRGHALHRVGHHVSTVAAARYPGTTASIASQKTARYPRGAWRRTAGAADSTRRRSRRFGCRPPPSNGWRHSE